MGLRSVFREKPAYILGGILRPLISWCCIIAILGFGSKHLNFSNRVLKYGNEAVLGFYILHQTIILTIGFFITSWNANLALKYLVLSTSSFAAIVVIYELLIRRIDLFRLLFGMKIKKE